MLIDESKAILGGRLENPLEGDLAKEAFSTAIDVMCKYQKIDQIVKAWNDMNSFDSMAQISEVIEDGNVD